MCPLKYLNKHLHIGVKLHEKWKEVNGEIPLGYDIHHINGDGLDNHIQNLQCLKHGEHSALHRRFL